MNFAKVIRKLQLKYHAAAREIDPVAARELCFDAHMLARAYRVPAEVTDLICRLAHENESEHPILYSPPADAHVSTH